MQGSKGYLPYKVFVYGSIKKGQRCSCHIKNEENGLARFMCSAKTVLKWPLVIGTKYNVPFLLYAQDRGKNVHGEVYEVDEKMFAFLDKFEGHPDVYQREEVKVCCSDDCDGDKHQTCWTYFLKDFPEKLLDLPTLENYDNWGEHGRPFCAPPEIHVKGASHHDFRMALLE